MVTAADPQGLNLILQQKIAHVVMTKPLPQTKAGFFSLKAYDALKKDWDRFDALAIGPGIGREAGTQQFVRQVVLHCPKPLVVDADALFALSGHLDILVKAKGPRILTPHAGEMARLVQKSVQTIEVNRLKIAREFAEVYQCTLLLKGYQTIIASTQGKTAINRTGNAGMATAGSGDVLTGIITAFLGQGLSPFDAAKWGAYYHGKAGDMAAKSRGKLGMIAQDIIDYLSQAL